jgi:outer membrane protein assembly factor BamB
MSIHCPNCNTLAASGDRFCGQCGTRLTQEATQALTPEAKRPRSLPAVRGEILWSLSLPGDIDDVATDEEGRFALTGPSERKSIFVKSMEIADESLEDPLTEFEEDIIVDSPGVENGILSALDTDDGKKIWSAGFGKEPFGVKHLSLERLAVCLYGRGSIIALNRTTGRPCWHHKMKHQTEWTPGAVSNGMIVAGDGRTLLALDAGTGGLRWEVMLESPIKSIVAASQAVLATTVQGFISAFDPCQGTPLWRKELPASDLQLAADRYVIVSLEKGRSEGETTTFLALDLVSGAERWNLETEAQIYSMTTDSRCIYIWTWNNLLRAFDLEKGTEIWAMDDMPWDMTCYWTGSDLVLVFDGERILALDHRDGSLRWDVPTGEYDVVSAAIDGGANAVYIGTEEGLVASLDPATGAIRWEAVLPRSTVEFLETDTGGKEKKVARAVNAGIDRIIPDGRGRLFVMADGILFAVE